MKILVQKKLKKKRKTKNEFQQCTHKHTYKNMKTMTEMGQAPKTLGTKTNITKVNEKSLNKFKCKHTK